MTSITIFEQPNSTWTFDGHEFYCTHDEKEIVTWVEDHMGFGGPFQTESEGYICAECGEPLEGSPKFDRLDAEAEAIAEEELMRTLGK